MTTFQILLLQGATKQDAILTLMSTLTDSELLQQHLDKEKYGVSVNLTWF